MGPGDDTCCPSGITWDRGPRSSSSGDESKTQLQKRSSFQTGEGASGLSRGPREAFAARPAPVGFPLRPGSSRAHPVRLEAPAVASGNGPEAGAGGEERAQEGMEGALGARGLLTPARNLALARVFAQRSRKQE